MRDGERGFEGTVRRFFGGPWAMMNDSLANDEIRYDDLFQIANAAEAVGGAIDDP